jgi:hypothetical protein
MKKSSHKSIYSLYKSCSIRNWQNWFIIFLIFLWISMQFTSFRHNTKEEKNLLAQTPLERLTSSHLCPPVENLHRYAPDGGGSSPPAMWAQGWQTSGRGARFHSPRVCWPQIGGQGLLRRAGTAETYGGGCWNLNSGEPMSWAGQQVRGEVLGYPREGLWVLGRLREQPAHGAHQGGPMAAATAAVDQNRCG